MSLSNGESPPAGPVLPPGNSPGPVFYYTVFFLSGLTGVIYESVWAQYLKLFLGHAAYAQTLVLVIFMGGMALGAYAASRKSQDLKDPLMAYAAIEVAVGLAAILFHPVFLAANEFSFNTIIPAIDSPFAVKLYQWVLGAALILPQSILLGATFPVMSAGVIRRYPESSGRALALLYFSNSLGASAGALLAGFVLIGAFGLPGSIQFGGALNIIIALAIWLTAGAAPSSLNIFRNGGGQPGDATGGVLEKGKLLFILLFCAWLTGLSSFLYEIGWIRMLSMTLGASTHAFELMLSSFILGIAIGGFWLRGRIQRLKDAFMTLAVIQLAMGVFALLTIPFYTATFHAMSFAMTALSKTQEGYLMFNLVSHFIAMAVMVPATICAGMTLPLITYMLLSYGHREEAIGRVYAVNTFGAIVGVTLAVQVIMPIMGVNWLIAIGAVFDIGLGMWLIGYSTDAAAKKQAVKLGAALLLLLSAVMIFGRAKPEIMASGVFRKGKLPVEGKTEVLYARDGKTATVHMIRNYEEGTLSIVTNGKVDASIAEDPDRNSPDEPTMALLGALPLALKPDAKFVANIGIGSGMTTHTLLQWPGLERVDTIEIEPFMVEGARMYGKRVERTFSDPRSFIRIEDAKTYFTAAKQKYDLIISEPSNPWVSGVAGLFSSEFYSHAARHMSKGALFVQWIHLYEIDYESAASVIKAIEKNFHDYELYFTNDIDLLIVASADGKVPQLSGEIFSAPELKRTLGGLGIVSKTDLNLRKIGDRAMLSPFFGLFAVEANSDYYPVLDQRAAKARFLNKNVVSLSQIAFSPLPLWRLSPAREHPLNGGQEPGENKFFQFGRKAQKAKALMSVIIGEDEHIPLPHLLEDEAMALAHGECHNEVTSKIWVGALSDLAPQLLPYLTENDLAQVWKAIEGSACYRSGPSFVRQWVELFRASRSGDIPALEKASGALLEIKGWKKHDRVLLHKASALAHIIGGRAEPARKALLMLPGKLFERDDVRLLAGALKQLVHKQGRQPEGTGK